jgi:hypothetical protein
VFSQSACVVLFRITIPFAINSAYLLLASSTFTKIKLASVGYIFEQILYQVLEVILFALLLILFQILFFLYYLIVLKLFE